MTEAPTFKIEIIARICDLSERHLRRLVKEGVLSGPAKKGQWPITNVSEYIRHLRGDADGAGTVGVNDAHKHRTRLLKEQADKLELENELTRGKLVDMEKCVAVFGSFVDGIQKNVLSIPSKVGPLAANETDPAVCEAITDKFLRETLTDISQYDPANDPQLKNVVGADAGNVPGDRPKGKTPAAPKSKRVGGRKKKTQPRGKRRTRPVDNKSG